MTVLAEWMVGTDSVRQDMQQCILGNRKAIVCIRKTPPPSNITSTKKNAVPLQLMY